MPHIDDFWDDIVDDGLVDPDQGGRARARFIQVGGGLDTAVLENAPLDAEARQTLLEMAARALGRKLASPTALAEPDAEAVRHIPRNVVDRYGVMPARDEKGRLILITPPLAPHVFNELKSRLGRSFDVRLALEIDIRLALARHFDMPLPSRFEVLRSGRLPGRSALSGVTARRPMPKPRDAGALMPVPAAPATPAPAAPSGNQARSWLSEASGRLRKAREREGLFALLATAGAAVLDGRFYLLRLDDDRVQCVAGTGLPRGAGPSLTLHRDSRLDHALRIGSSRLEDWSHDPDLTALYTALGRARPARVMIEPIRDGLDVVGVFVGDHGRAGIDRGVVGDLRRWLSRISTRLADLRGSRAPAPQPPPLAEPPPPPRVAPPAPPAARAQMPPADPFALPSTRRRRRKPLDLQELAEAARTAQATADALPTGESQEFVFEPPADPEPPATPPAPPAASTPPEPETLPVEPIDPPAAAVGASDPGLPFDVDDDPLAGFLSDPEIEAVAEALVADEPRALELPSQPPAALPGAPTMMPLGPTGQPSDGAMGAPPNTLPSRPHAMPPAERPRSVFEAILPQTASADESEGRDEQGSPPPTRPARPSAGRGAEAREADGAPSSAADRPGPTINLRGPEAQVERRRRPTADLGPRPADISVDELLEEAKAARLRREAEAAAASAPEPAPRPARINARSTVDLKGDADDEPLDDPPPLDDDDDPTLHARKTINLRRAESTPPPPSGEVLELDDADVLEISDEVPGEVEPAVDVLDVDVVEVIEAGVGLSRGAEALRARRELEEADTGVFTVLDSPVESVAAAPSAPVGVELAEAETAEHPEVLFEPSEPPGAGAVADLLDALPVAAPARGGPVERSDEEPSVAGAPDTPNDDAAGGSGERAAPDDDDPDDDAEVGAPDASVEVEPAGEDDAGADGPAAPAPDAAHGSDHAEAGEGRDADAPSDAPEPANSVETPEGPEAEAASVAEAAGEAARQSDDPGPSQPAESDEAVDPVAAEVSDTPESADPEPVASGPEAEPADAPDAAADSEPAAHAAGGEGAEPPDASGADEAAGPDDADRADDPGEAGPAAPAGAADAADEDDGPDDGPSVVEAHAADDAPAPDGADEPDDAGPADAADGAHAAGPAHEDEAADAADAGPGDDAEQPDTADRPDAEEPGEAEAPAAVSNPPAPAAPAEPSERFESARRDLEPSAPALAIDDLLDAPDDEFSDLDLVLSPPPAPQPSPTFEVIDALDLDGGADDGVDFDLDLGLEPVAEPADAEPADAEPDFDPESPAPPGPDPEKMAEAVVALTGGDAEIARTAEEVLVSGGATALGPLFAVFPGPLVVDRYAVGEPAPVARHGPVLRTICRIGAPAGPHLAARCDHLAPDVRYYAVYAFSAVRDPASVAAIAPALTDKDATVRAIACRVADTYRGDEIFGVLVAHLVNIVEKGRLADRRLAAEALGALHTAAGAASLIAMLGAPQPPLRDAAHKALVEIARQDFGDDVWRWRTFFERSADRPRVEWLLDGLLSDQRTIRVGAFRELKRITHQNYGYTPDAPPATRRAAAERWVRWWHQTGRAKFGHYR